MRLANQASNSHLAPQDDVTRNNDNRSPHVFNIQVRSNANMTDGTSANIEILKDGMPDDKPHRRRKTAKRVAQPLPAIETLQKRQEPKPASPIKHVNIAEKQAKDKAQRIVHTNFVHNVLGKFGMYTSAKTIPVSVSSEHKNQVDTFARNFAKVADPMAQFYKSAAGYASEDDKNLIRFGVSKKIVKPSELA